MFFTLIRKMGFALHEMYEISGLVMGDAPYEEYVPSTEEMHLLKKDDPLVCKTYWKLLCHFQICTQTTGWRSGGIKQMVWTSYLFNDLNDKTSPVTRLTPSTEKEIEERISASTSSYTTESNEDTFKLDVIFESFHDQARVPIFDRALLAGFLIIWLKRCMVPTLPREVIIAT